MKFNVTEVEFDFDDWYQRNWDNKLTFDEEIEDYMECDFKKDRRVES